MDNDTANVAITKKIDPTSGKFYHVIRTTGQVIWDNPHRSNVPIDPFCGAIRTKIAFNHQTAALKKKRCKEERLALIQVRQTEYAQKEMMRKATLEREEKKKKDEIWEHACQQGKITGKVRLEWEKMGYISDQVYSFSHRYRRNLTHLWIVGNELESIGDIPLHCHSLTLLSLASNKITDFSSALVSLKNLTSINLLRNRIEKLPSNIGDLVSLTNLELANNLITEIPPSFGKLVNLDRLNLECNRIRSLPESFGGMKCTTLNLNFNNLTTLHPCVGSMIYLKFLSINENYLKYLPEAIGNCSTLEILHVCKNKLMELPYSLGKLRKLKKIWLGTLG